MAEMTVQVTEQMANFIGWANVKGEDEIRRITREHLAEIKEEAKMKGNKLAGWDDALEPNDGNDQWKHGGDCNLCRKASYCMTKCRANKLLKKITTPLLYQEYVNENPDLVAQTLDPMKLAESIQKAQ